MLRAQSDGAPNNPTVPSSGIVGLRKQVTPALLTPPQRQLSSHLKLCNRSPSHTAFAQKGEVPSLTVINSSHSGASEVTDNYDSHWFVSNLISVQGKPLASWHCPNKPVQQGAVF